MNPEEELKKGVFILEPVMSKYGFSFVYEPSGNGSGGHFAAGYFENANRRLNLSVRYSLGCVTYQLDKREVEHSEYLRAVGAKGKYPGFSNVISEAFKHLASDINNYFSIFLNGSDSELIQKIEFEQKNPNKTGFGALP